MYKIHSCSKVNQITRYLLLEECLLKRDNLPIQTSNYHIKIQLFYGKP